MVEKSLMQLSVKHQNPTNIKPSLLDTLSVWLNTPDLAYNHWISLQPYRSSSRQVYSAMFRRFCQWLEQHHLRLDQCSSAHIATFLDSDNPNLPESRRRPQTSRQRQQYVLLLERIFSHLGALGRVGHNPGRQAGIDRVGAGSDKPTRFLNPDERDAVIALAQARLEHLRTHPLATEDWVAYRDLALVGATLGAGLKPGQLVSLSLNCIDLSEGVIDNAVVAHSHRAVLLPFARESLAAWVEILGMLFAETLAMSGRAGGTPEQWRKSQLVFIADRSGSGFGRFSTTQRMHVSSIFRRIQGFLNEAGVTGSRASPQTLRNTYAALLIESGASDAELITTLGLSTELTAKRIRASWTSV